MFKKLKESLEIHKTLVAILAVLGAFSLKLGIVFYENAIGDLFTNISAAFLYTIITILIIDQYLEDKRESRFQQLKEEIKQDFKSLIYRTLSSIAIYMNIYTFQVIRDFDSEKQIKDIFKPIQQVQAKNILTKIPGASLKEIYDNLIEFSELLNKKILLYKDYLPRDLVGELFRLLLSAENVKEMFKLSFREETPKTRNILLTMTGDFIDNYFDELENFFKAIIKKS